MRRHVYIVFAMFIAVSQLCAQSFTAQVREGLYVDLRWHGVFSPMELFRKLPGDGAYRSLGAVVGDGVNDTVNRSVCGDTIRYRLDYGAGQSLETAVWFTDAITPQPTDIQIVTVDSLADSIIVTWNPSISSDVDAYIICSGSPCVSPDTVYSTRYAVEYQTSPLSFRLFVVDSCGNPSALSPPCNNLQLNVKADSCGGTVNATWNEYRNMPGGISAYRIYYSIAKPYEWQFLDSVNRLSVHVPMPEGVTDSCYFRVEVTGLSSGLSASSNPVGVALGDISNEECSHSHQGDVDGEGEMFSLPNVLLYGQAPNDRFQPCPSGVLPSGISGYRLDIYCRTGRRVFHSENPGEPFVGRSKSGELPGGAYVYLLFYTTNGVQQVKKGQLLLLK